MPAKLHVCLASCDVPLLSALRYLFGFEEYCCSAGITFRTIHHNDPLPSTTMSYHKKGKGDVKESFMTPLKEHFAEDKKEEADSESESEKEVKERHSSPRVRIGSLFPFQ